MTKERRAGVGKMALFVAFCVLVYYVGFSSGVKSHANGVFTVTTLPDGKQTVTRVKPWSFSDWWKDYR